MVKVWGDGADLPVPADYDGDGKDDFAVWNKAHKTWKVIHSSDLKEYQHKWNDVDDQAVPVPGKYDGDNKTDQAFWKNGGKWTIKRSGDQQQENKVHGSSGDKPIPGKKRKPQ